MISSVPGMDLKTIVYATDFSANSKNAGAYARLLAKRFSAPLVVAHAFTLSQAAMEVEVQQKLISQQRKDVRALLDNCASALKFDSVRITTELAEGDPAAVIPALTDRYASALLVLGTHGGGRIERTIIGSVAEEILRTVRWPCLTVGPHTAPAPAATLPFKRILCAADFTPAAARAASYAVFFAEAVAAKIDMLHVVTKDDVDHPDRLSEFRKHFFSTLNTATPRQAREHSDARTFVEAGKARDQILRHIREHSVDLLVLGVRKGARHGLEAFTSGAFQLIVDAPCPVLTING